MVFFEGYLCLLILKALQDLLLSDKREVSMACHHLHETSKTCTYIYTHAHIFIPTYV